MGSRLGGKNYIDHSHDWQETMLFPLEEEYTALGPRGFYIRREHCSIVCLTMLLQLLC